MIRYVYNKFNRGEVDSAAFGREDVDRLNSSAAQIDNFLPMRLGPMMYRPGMQYLGETNSNAPYFVPFIAATDDTALLEFSGTELRVWVSDSLVTRSSVTTTISNEKFNVDLSGWFDLSETGSTAVWKSGGYASLTGSGSTKAVLYQTTTFETNANSGIRFTITRAPVVLKIGTTGASSSNLYKGTLLPGTHSLAINPGSSSSITITFENSARYETLIDSVEVEGAGVLELPVSVVDPSKIRTAQSADIVYIAIDGSTKQHFQVERRGTTSWSVVDFRADDGPFEKINSTDISLKVSDLSGDVNLLSSASFFTTSHVGVLFKLSSLGQVVTADVSAADNGTDSIEVNGVSSSRNVDILITGTWVATVTLQRAPDNSTWEDVKTYTVNKDITYNDSFKNATMYYRLYVKTGDYTSGTVGLSISNTGGSIDGIARVTQYVNTTKVNVQVLKSFGSTSYTRDWYIGSWSEDNGYPSAVEFYEGRLWWAGKNKLWGSVSDAYTSYDRDIEGDSVSIQKTIGFGPVDSVHWLKESNRLIVGTASDEISVRSNSFGETLTATNANLKRGSNQGVAEIEPTRLDDNIIFVQRSENKIYELEYNFGSDKHQADDLMTLHPSICSSGITRIAIARQPETRIFAISGGNTAVLLTDKTEQVAGWSTISTNGTIVDVAVLPGVDEDTIYFAVNRSGGNYLEKMAKLSEAEGGLISKHFDSFVNYAIGVTTLTGLGHLEGETVGVWGEGQDRGTDIVVGGQITVADTWDGVTVGLPHTANYTSNKLNGSSKEPMSTRINQRKRVVDVGLVMKNYWPGSVLLGPSTAELEIMPEIEDGYPIRPGPELVTNGTFNSNVDGWTITDGTAEYDLGRMAITPDALSAKAYAEQEITGYYPGLTYEITADIDASEVPSFGGSVHLFIGTYYSDTEDPSTLAADLYAYANGGSPDVSISGTFVMPYIGGPDQNSLSTGVYVQLGAQDTNGAGDPGTIYFDNVSIKLSAKETVDYDEVPFEFNGENEPDPRIYIRATGPCNILALEYGLDDGED